MKEINTNTLLGIDAVEVNITTGKDTNIKETEFFHSRTGVRIGRIVKRSGKENGYCMSICFPKLLRKDNRNPFSISDSIYLDTVYCEIQTQLMSLFKTNIKDIYVKSVEVNATAQLKNPENIKPIMNLFSLMFVQSEQKGHKVFHGENNTAYSNVPLSKNIFRKVEQTESLHTTRMGHCRYSWKIYDKGRELKEKGKAKEDKGILRIEQKISARGLKYIKVPLRLDEFLVSNNIKKLVEQYKREFKEFLRIYWWSDRKERFPDCLVNTIVLELEENKGQPLLVAKMHKELLYIDIDIFKRACLKFYPNKKTALQAVRRVRQSQAVMIHEKTIAELVQIFRAIIC